MTRRDEYEYIKLDNEGRWVFRKTGKPISDMYRLFEEGADADHVARHLGCSPKDLQDAHDDVKVMLDQGPKKYKNSFTTLAVADSGLWALSKKSGTVTVAVAFPLSVIKGHSLRQQAKTLRFTEGYMNEAFREILCLLDGVRP